MTPKQTHSLSVRFGTAISLPVRFNGSFVANSEIGNELSIFHLVLNSGPNGRLTECSYSIDANLKPTYKKYCYFGDGQGKLYDFL